MDTQVKSVVALEILSRRGEDLGHWRHHPGVGVALVAPDLEALIGLSPEFAMLSRSPSYFRS